MTDYTPKKPRRDSGVNADTPDFAAWDHQPGDPERFGWCERRAGVDVRLNDVNQPSSYDGLSDAEKATLQEWISRELRAADVEGRFCTYGLKHICQRMTGCYASNGQFKGAMLAAGFEPVDRYALTWKFEYVHDRQLFERSCGRAA